MPGGIPTYTMALAAHLRKLGTRLDVLVGGSDGRTVLVPWRRDLSKYDVVHVQSVPYGPLVSKHPLVVTSHSPTLEEGRYYPFPQVLKLPAAYLSERLCLARADAVVAVSNLSRQLLIERYGVNADRIRYVPLGVDAGHFSPGMKKSKSGAPKVLICSRLEPRKNVNEALTALSKVKDLPYELEVIGDGSERGRLESLSGELGLRASFRGALGRDELYASFVESDVFISPSRSEGFGLSALEAMASGCALVLSDIPAHREFVTRMHNGILYSDHKQLVDSLRRLLTDTSFAVRLGEKAREAAEQYSWDRVARATLDLYKLLAKR
jgi:glycosyltransferase involved in cell wall biosynthesis